MEQRRRKTVIVLNQFAIKNLGGGLALGSHGPNSGASPNYVDVSLRRFRAFWASASPVGPTQTSVERY
jgi:hypothetical protein